MERSKLVVIERDMYCPYCNTNSAVIISETVSSKSRMGCAAIGLKDGCLLTVTGGCWANGSNMQSSQYSGFTFFDSIDKVKSELSNYYLIDEEDSVSIRLMQQAA